ncbi:uncharacterized protein LOC117601722, partial [Osmia lignaria lignaria]|uniref:uncharacterized protein LOC117601722 n=1 Tax=Osmia lignaria lignaria TaxID=1437193 RepID=UPI00402B985A
SFIKMYCCAGGIYCEYINGVQFEKLKTKYNIDEDIVVDYTLQDKVHTSTHDWIGIFPRGWTNLQQYLTFEYIVVAPKLLSSSNRSIVFLHTFHREASPNIDYQFVYVSKKVVILGTSSYFRFVVSPSLRSLDRKPDTPEIVHEAHLPSIVSPRPTDTGKIMTKSKSIDSFIEFHRSTCGFSADQPRRTCRHCNNSRFDSSFTTKKVQFLSLLNEHLMARVGRLDRDLDLTEAALKSEKMARTVLSKKLQAYQSFVEKMFKCLNSTGIVNFRDQTGKEITVEKVKSKELSSIRVQQGDKFVPVPEVSMLHRSSECKKCNDEETAEANKTVEILQGVNLISDEALKKEQNVPYDFDEDIEKVLENLYKQPSLAVETSITAPKIQEASVNQSDFYATKEANKAVNEQEDNEVELKGTESNVDDCHSNDFKIFDDNLKFDENNLQEWVLEGECCLKISNKIHQMMDNVEMNLENCLKNHENRDASSEMSENMETGTNRDKVRSKTFTVTIKCRNAKFSTIK